MLVIVTFVPNLEESIKNTGFPHILLYCYTQALFFLKKYILYKEPKFALKDTINMVIFKYP